MEYNKEVIQYVLKLHEEGVFSYDIAKRTSNKFREQISVIEVGLIVKAYESKQQVQPTERKHWPVSVD